MSQLTS